MTRVIRLTLIVLAMLVVAACLVTFAASALPDEPIELQPYYLLMDGEYGRGVVYALDYGWLVVTSSGTIYTCGCEECTVDEMVKVLTYETPIPSTNPTPTIPVPIEPTPAENVKANCGLGNGSEGADPNENACGKKTGEENE